MQPWKIAVGLGVALGALLAAVLVWRFEFLAPYAGYIAAEHWLAVGVHYGAAVAAIGLAAGAVARSLGLVDVGRKVDVGRTLDPEGRGLPRARAGSARGSGGDVHRMSVRTPSSGAVHALRVAVLTLACTSTAALVAVAALLHLAADEPNPWQTVQTALVDAFGAAAPLVAALLAGGAALAPILLAGLVLWTIGARARGWLHPAEPERATGGEGRRS